MKVILREDVDGLGRKGDICDVTLGYARNFLLPKGKAMKSSEGAEAQAESMRRARALRNAADRSDAEELATKLVPMVITIGARSSEEGSLFGSVSLNDVADAISEQSGIELDRRVLTIEEPIKAVGTHYVMAAPHPEVQFPVTVEVVSV